MKSRSQMMSYYMWLYKNMDVFLQFSARSTGTYSKLKVPISSQFNHDYNSLTDGHGNSNLNFTQTKNIYLYNLLGLSCLFEWTPNRMTILIWTPLFGRGYESAQTTSDNVKNRVRQLQFPWDKIAIFSVSFYEIILADP